MFLDFLVAAVLLLCLLGLGHGLLPAARQQQINQRLRWRLRHTWATLQQLPADWRAQRGRRSARTAAQAVIERARRDAAGAQVHDLDRFRQQRGASARTRAEREGDSSEPKPDRLH